MGDEQNVPSAEEQQSLEQTPSTRLASWYRQLGRTSLDIVGDFVGHSLFVIHGDSLIRYCLPNGQVDFQGEYKKETLLLPTGAYDLIVSLDGFQLLHAIHEVEQLLSNLKKRGCNFHVVFFRSHTELCVPSGTPEGTKYKYYLTRAVLLEHLKRIASQVPAGEVPPTEVFEFESMEDDDFHKYMKENVPQLFMTHDGEDVGKSDEEDPNTEKHRTWLLHMMYKLVLRGYKIAVLNELFWRDCKVCSAQWLALRLTRS